MNSQHLDTQQELQSMAGADTRLAVRQARSRAYILVFMVDALRALEAWLAPAWRLLALTLA